MYKMNAEVYQNFCATNNIPVDQNIVAALVRSSTTREVSLAGVNIISVQNCEALGSIISSCSEISKLDLSNSMLPITGLCALFESLVNSHLCALNLKGNNIYGNATVRLSHLLSKNTSIKVLLLEWNDIGTPEQAFSSFCNSLKNNHTLEVLDLRNNNLGSECAGELADLILNNKSIKCLDLRWNSIGVEGGQKILAALNCNSTLNILRVQGNGIPADMICAIDNTVKHNHTVRKLNTEHAARQDMLTQQLKCMNQKRIDDIKTMCDQSSQQLQPCLDKMKEYSVEKRKLTEDLERSKIKILELEEMIVSLEAQLESTSVQVDCKQQIIEKQEKTVCSIREQSQCDIEAVRAKFLEDEQKLREEIETFQTMILKEKASRETLESKLYDSQLAIDSLIKETQDLKERLDIVSENHNKVIEEEKKMQQELMEQFQRQLKTEKEESVEVLERVKRDDNEKIELLEKKLLELEGVLENDNAVLLAERSLWNEEKALLLAESCEKQTVMANIMTEELEEVKREKIKLEEELSQSQTSLKTLLAENKSLKSELSMYMSQVSLLQNQLTESKVTLEHLQTGQSNTTQYVQSLKDEAEMYRKELAAVRQMLSDLQMEFSVQNDKHRKEISELNYKLQSKLEEIAKLRTDEMEKAHALCAAVQKYIGSGNKSCTL